MLYEFVATGPGVNQRWRRTLPSNQAVRLGRAPRQGWAVPWDLRVSREHADLMLSHDRLTVRRLNVARNQIYVRGEPREEFSIAAGEDFRIGRTVFRMAIVAPPKGNAAAPVAESSATPDSDMDGLTRQPTKQRLMGILQQIDQPDQGDLEAGSHSSADESPPRFPRLQGTVLDNYEVREAIFRNSSTVVVNAWHRYLEDWAAIQFFDTTLARSESDCARFRWKAACLRRWQHPGLIRGFDAGQLGRFHYLVMEYFPSQNLACGSGAHLPGTNTLVGYTRQAAAALAYAHGHGVVHGALQPGDILVDRDGHVKLTGWSRSTGRREMGLHDSLLDAPMTPCPPDVAADIRGLGTTLFSLLTAGIEMEQNGSQEHASHADTRLNISPNGVPAGLSHILQRMVADDPEHGFCSMHEVLIALQNFAG